MRLSTVFCRLGSLGGLSQRSKNLCLNPTSAMEFRKMDKCGQRTVWIVGWLNGGIQTLKRVVISPSNLSAFWPNVDPS